MIDFQKALSEDLERYTEKGGKVQYPFPVEDFALRTFGLDIQHEDFDTVFESSKYDPQELFACLFPDGREFQGLDKVILVNSNRKPFIVAGKAINRAYYYEFAERQTIAHEIGHYSDKYVHNKSDQTSLFMPYITADDPVSIIVYPKNSETFANKYARHLLLPEDKVTELIHRNNIRGTFDLNAMINEFSKAFAVTRYMLEIRLHELSIHFTNGIYIKSFNRSRGKKYSADDLIALMDIVKAANLSHSYYDADNFCGLYNLRTGQTRASGALYMAFMRILNGAYDKYPGVFEKRISPEFAELGMEVPPLE